MKIQIGTHALMVGDITTDAVSQLMGAELADVIYSDPPWGPGNQQYWHTMRSRGSVPRTSWPGFLAAFCGVCAAHRKPDAPVLQKNPRRGRRCKPKRQQKKPTNNRQNKETQQKKAQRQASEGQGERANVGQQRAPAEMSREDMRGS